MADLVEVEEINVQPDHVHTSPVDVCCDRPGHRPIKITVDIYVINADWRDYQNTPAKNEARVNSILIRETWTSDVTVPLQDRSIRFSLQLKSPVIPANS